jgi:hypothetical protein
MTTKSTAPLLTHFAPCEPPEFCVWHGSSVPSAREITSWSRVQYSRQSRTGQITHANEADETWMMHMISFRCYSGVQQPLLRSDPSTQGCGGCALTLCCFQPNDRDKAFISAQRLDAESFVPRKIPSTSAKDACFTQHTREFTSRHVLAVSPGNHGEYRSVWLSDAVQSWEISGK